MEKIKFEYISYFKCSLVNFLKKKGYSDKNIYYLIYNTIIILPLIQYYLVHNTIIL